MTASRSTRSANALPRARSPTKVVNLACERGMSPMAAWREHFALTQAEVAARIGITQAAYAQMERVKQPRKATLDKVAEAMGLKVERLRW
jgi:DNA-binding XRE family transcriptional regulator